MRLEKAISRCLRDNDGKWPSLIYGFWINIWKKKTNYRLTIVEIWRKSIFLSCATSLSVLVDILFNEVISQLKISNTCKHSSRICTNTLSSRKKNPLSQKSRFQDQLKQLSVKKQNKNKNKNKKQNKKRAKTKKKVTRMKLTKVLILLSWTTMQFYQVLSQLHSVRKLHEV